MKNFMTLVAAMAVLTLCSSAEALARETVVWRGGGGWGPGAPYIKLYNPQAVETISGEIISVDRVTLRADMYYGIHIVVKTADEKTIAVHLGPGWFIENQDVKIEPRDRVEVTGSRIVYEGKPAFIAAEVKKGDEVLTLREANGVPAWIGWRRR